MAEYVDLITRTGQSIGQAKLKKEAERDGDWHKANHLGSLIQRKNYYFRKGQLIKNSIRILGMSQPPEIAVLAKKLKKPRFERQKKN